MASNWSYSWGSSWGNAWGVTASEDTRLDQILALLTGRKVYDPATHLWRVYDSGGVEIADVGGVLQRGLHGWLLWTNAYGQFTAEITLAPAGNTRRNKVKAKVLAPVFAPTAKRWGVEEDEALLMACM